MHDTPLLHEFVATGSQRAFAGLVQQYINLVYSAARRQVRDAHLAEDITQAVFIILAKKAAAVRNPAMLGGWLLRTTHQVSCNALRMERCRQKHEREAAAMKSRSVQSQPIEHQIEPVLDEAMSRLGARDQCAIVLRFLEGKSIAEVGQAMGLSQDAAQKRLSRAINKLRNIFARRGINTAAEALSGGMSARMLHAAPSSLVLTVSSNAKAANALSLAGATTKTIFWANVKTSIVACAASIAVIAGVAGIAVNSSPTTHAAADVPTTAPAAAPAEQKMRVTFDNADIFTQDTSNIQFGGNEFALGLDAKMLRTPDSKPAGHINSLQTATRRSMCYCLTPAEPLRGKRIRFSAWLKTRNVANWGGIGFIMNNTDGQTIVVGDNCSSPARENSDWRQYQVVANVPNDAESIKLEAFLFGSGEMWVDEFLIEEVSTDVPVSDDSTWRKWSARAPAYNVALDPAVKHEGHPATCISSISATSGLWCSYDFIDRRPDKLLGHKIRVSAWIKSEGVSTKSGLWVRNLGSGGFSDLDTVGSKAMGSITGTTDWNRYSTVVDVPQEAGAIEWGLILRGKGKIWIDTETVLVEVIDDPSPAQAK